LALSSVQDVVASCTSRTLFGPLTRLPTGPAPPIESLEGGRLERVHSGTGTEGSVIWDWGPAA
jgi:hypothetical protein